MDIQIDIAALSILIGAVVGVTQVIKAFVLDARFAPVISLALGIAGAFFVAPAATLGLTIFTGVVVGLSASGLWSGTKTTSLAIKQAAE